MQKAELQAEELRVLDPFPPSAHSQHGAKPFLPLSILSFHLGQARGRVHQTVPETAGIPGLQGLVNQDHSREHLHSYKELLLAELLQQGEDHIPHGPVKGLGAYLPCCPPRLSYILESLSQNPNGLIHSLNNSSYLVVEKA